MEKWIFIPWESVNGIKFGSSREEVRRQLGGEYSEFKKTKFSKNTTDNYGSFYVYYDKDDCMEAIEIFDNIGVELNGVSIYPNNLEKLKEQIEDLIQEGGDYMSIKYSIGVSEDSILFGKKGYYN